MKLICATHFAIVFTVSAYCILAIIVLKYQKRDIKENDMKKIKPSSLGQLFLIAVILAAIIAACSDSHNSVLASPLKIQFAGQYRIADGDWQTITPKSNISALQGDVTLRGYFEGITPDGENIGRLQENLIVLFRLNHIGGEIYADGECVHIFDSENPQIGSFTCGDNISTYMLTDNESKAVEIVLRNPHSFGNGNAVNQFLDSMCIYSTEQENNLITQGSGKRTVCIMIIILSMVLCGIALFLTLLRIPYSRILWQTAAVIFFAGGYGVMSAPYIFLWSNHTMFNTYSIQICGAMYAFFILCIIAELLYGRHRTVCGISISVMGAAICILLLLSFTGAILPYDICAYLSVFITVSSVITMICCAAEMKKSGAMRKAVLVGAMIVTAAFVADTAGMTLGIWQGCLASVVVFGLVFVIAVIYALRFIPRSILAAMREEELQQELQESRIAIMLSQIQPHFLYNVLNTIYHLCGKDNDTAKKVISNFSDYLRNNLDSLEQKSLVPFSTELQHVKTYLDLEKVRFDDELEIVYDITVKDFFLPVMTIQPLAENAVKHGISKKRGGGRLVVSTAEKADCYEIIVSDSGNGFDTENSEKDGASHVGIENVRQRLKNMCSGRLDIKSKIGNGTTAVVVIPKKEG